jgi:hypothetical protein
VITEAQMHGPVYREEEFAPRWTDSRTTGLAEQVQSQYDTRQEQVTNLFTEAARKSEDHLESTLAAQKVLWEFDWADETFHTDIITGFSGAPGSILEVGFIDEEGRAQLGGYLSFGENTDPEDHYPDLAHSKFHNGKWTNLIPSNYEGVFGEEEVYDDGEFVNGNKEPISEVINDWIIGANSELIAGVTELTYGWEVPVDPSDEYWRRLGRAMDAVQGTQVASLEEVEYIRMKRDLTRAANTLTYGDVLRAEIQDGETQYLKDDEKVLLDENWDPEV